MSSTSAVRSDAHKAALEVLARLRASGHSAYFVGGCVRDIVLGREPADYDIATSATPDEVMALFERTIAVGAQFGVVLVLCDAAPSEGVTSETAASAMKIEVATYRADVAYSDGRHPD